MLLRSILLLLLLTGCATAPAGRPPSSSSPGPPAAPGTRAPSDGERAGTRLYRVRENGIRCVAAPCFALTASDAAGGARKDFSDLDLSGLGLPSPTERLVRQRILRGDALVRGHFRELPGAGPAGAGLALVIEQVVDAAAPSR